MIVKLCRECGEKAAKENEGLTLAERLIKMASEPIGEPCPQCRLLNLITR